jgi:hypothetical protein
MGRWILKFALSQEHASERDSVTLLEIDLTSSKVCQSCQF